MNKISFFRVLLGLISGMALTAVGCGIYSFSGSTIPGHIKTVSVPLFEDATAEFGVDQEITDALIEAITKDNTLKIAGVRNSDSILRGKISSITDRAGQYDGNETASDFRITVTVQVVFEDVEKHTSMWEETFSQYGEYDNQDTRRDDGITKAIDKLTTEIINRTVSGW